MCAQVHSAPFHVSVAADDDGIDGENVLCEEDWCAASALMARSCGSTLVQTRSETRRPHSRVHDAVHSQEARGARGICEQRVVVVTRIVNGGYTRAVLTRYARRPRAQSSRQMTCAQAFRCVVAYVDDSVNRRGCGSLTILSRRASLRKWFALPRCESERPRRARVSAACAQLPTNGIEKGKFDPFMGECA